MTARWNELGAHGQAAVEAAFVALESVALLGRAAEAPATVAPSMLWAHLTGAAPLPAGRLAAALLADPELRDTLRGMLPRAAVATGARVAAAASDDRVTERAGDGFRLRLLPARGVPDQTWIMIMLDRPDPAPTRLTVLPGDGAPVSVALDPPSDGTVQLLVASRSDLVRGLADPTSTVFLH